MMSDAHPANSWCHTVATFPSAEATYAALHRERLGHREVLWVRFSEEDPDFDYELLRHFTYHNCRSIEAHKISDKYVKGQEYPIVVIEGFPSFMDRYEESGHKGELEEKMWAFRREVYLCASRATGFLYFVCNPRTETPENIRIKEEIEGLVEAVSQPLDIITAGTKSWRISIKETDQKRSMDVFDDVNSSESEKNPALSHPLPQKQSSADTTEKQKDVEKTLIERRLPVSTPKSLSLEEPVTPRKLAAELGLKSYQVIADLMQIHVYSNVDQALDIEDVKKFCKINSIEFILNKDAEVAFTETPVHDEKKGTSSTSKPVLPSSSEIRPESAPQETAPEISIPTIESAFKHKIVVSGPLSVVDLAKELGVQPRDVMIHATRMGFYARGGSVLDIRTMRSIAARHGIGLELK
jgi:hypothetical protein